MAFATHRGFVHAGGSPYGLRGVPSACGFTGSGAHGGIAQLRRSKLGQRIDLELCSLCHREVWLCEVP